MSMKEYVGYLLAVLLLLWHLLSAELHMRLDWVNFGTQYQQTQNSMIQAIQALDRDVQTVKNRVDQLEQKKIAPPSEKKP